MTNMDTFSVCSILKKHLFLFLLLHTLTYPADVAVSSAQQCCGTHVEVSDGAKSETACG